MEYIQIKSALIEQLIEISKKAGTAILEIYNSDFDFTLKKDLSPLTKADKISHKLISDKLKILTPSIPVLSEESCDIPLGVRSKWEIYWLIDPLDGTKEFIKRNGEFTVNIALIKNNIPILGVIHVPVSNETYYGSDTNGSFYIKGDNDAKKINVSENNEKPLRILASRSHPSKILGSFLEAIGSYELIKKGSSIKFCLIASGQADIYPRFGQTSEWDIAAGEAIIKYSGGCIISMDGGRIEYNSKENFINPYFIASGSSIIDTDYYKAIKSHYEF